MRILLTGSNGQVGWELQRSLLPLGEVVAPGRDQLDLSRPEALRACMARFTPDVVVNAAAYTAVDQAESEKTLAMRVNAEAPTILAEQAAQYNALFVHYSTDYVFDGIKSNEYTEEDEPNPLNVYGESKLAGELGVMRSGADYLIFRTSWVYSHRGRNFVRTIRRLARERDELSIVQDQVGAPTWARLIAESTAYCVLQALAERRGNRFESGLFHLASRGAASWYEFGKAILDLEQERPEHSCQLSPIDSGDYPAAAQRPCNSRLAVGRLEERFGLYMPDWKIPLALCFAMMID